MVVSICPSFFCINRCKFCYLGILRAQTNLLDLAQCKTQLDQLKKYVINSIDIFGGDLTQCKQNYITQLITLCEKYTSNISITTNQLFDYEIANARIGLSLNTSRADFQDNLKKLELSNIQNISVVIDSELLNFPIKVFFDKLPRKQIEISFQKCTYSIYNTEYQQIENYDQRYEQFLIRLFECLKQYQHISVTNINDIKKCLYRRYDPSMFSNIFILPSGKFAVISYNDKHQEYFKSIESISNYDRLVIDENKKYFQKCCLCEFYPSCYAEHLDLTKICSGHKGLLSKLRDYDLSNLS